MEAIGTILMIFVALGAGAAVGYFVHRAIQTNRLGDVEELIVSKRKEGEEKAERLVRDAELKAKELVLQSKQEIEKEADKRKEELSGFEKILFQKEEKINKKTDYLDQREQDIRASERKLEEVRQELENKKQKLQETIDEQLRVLQQVAGMSVEEAKNQLLNSLINEAKHDAAKKVKQIEDEAREIAETKAKNIIALAIQRYSGDYVTERTVSVVALPNDDMKGRIIGREGRNIRALQAATGIDCIIDDTPEAVVLSGFDPIRRETARMALERLIEDGRIHPARIEEIVKKCELELEEKIKDFGQQAAFDLGIHGLNQEIVKLLGRLRYRTSYGQNVWSHSLEVGFIAGVIAAELGLSVRQARRAGLLHDIGKAVTHEVEGSHALIGANLARKYGESPKIVQAIAAHHEEEEPTLLGVIIQAADALSGARPGARREIMESYVQRLAELENIAQGFDGVEKSFAIQAGREVRVMAQSEKISDEDATVLANDIAKKIESEMTYPGQIKVVVIRETRAVGIAS